MVATGDGEGLRPARGFDAYLADIGGPDGFNRPIYRAICSYIGTHGVGGTDAVALRDRIAEAVLAKAELATRDGKRSEAEIKGYASARFLDDEIKRALARKAAEDRCRVAEIEEPTPRAQAYARSVARNEIRSLAAETAREDPRRAFREAAYRIGRVIEPGGLTVDGAAEALLLAAQGLGLDLTEAGTLAQQAVLAGMASPRELPR